MSLGAAASSGIPGIDAEYAGEPKRPDPWTTDTVRESLRDDGRGRVVCLAPDVCLTGPNKVPTPHMISDRCDHLVNYSKDVFHNGRRVLLFSDQGDHSKTQHVEGDEAGDGGGVKSGTNRGVCEPIDHAQNYRIEGRYVVRHLDKFWMNNRNTIGEGQFQLDMSAYSAPLDDDPIPGSLRRSSGGQPKGVEVADNTAVQMNDAAPSWAPFAPSGPPPADPTPSGDIWVRPNISAPKPVAPAPETDPPSWPTKLWRFGKWAKGAGAGLEYYFSGLDRYNLSDVVPEDEFEQEVVETFNTEVKSGANSWNARKKAMEAIQDHRAEKRAAKHEEPQTVPSQQTQGARSSEEKQENPCVLIRYGSLDCPKDYQGHHVVADRAFRSGAGGTSTYVDNMSRDDGLAICLFDGATTPGTEHNIASTAYRAQLAPQSTNGMVQLGAAESAGASAVQAATKGRCKAADIQAQLRAYHNAKGLGSDMWVREQFAPLEADHTPGLGSFSSGVTAR